MSQKIDLKRLTPQEIWHIEGEISATKCLIKKANHNLEYLESRIKLDNSLSFVENGDC